MGASSCQMESTNAADELAATTDAAVSQSCGSVLLWGADEPAGVESLPACEAMLLACHAKRCSSESAPRTTYFGSPDDPDVQTMHTASSHVQACAALYAA